MVKVAAPDKVTVHMKNGRTSNEVITFLTTHPTAFAYIAHKHPGKNWFVLIAEDASVYVLFEKGISTVVGVTEKNSEGVEVLSIDADKFDAILVKLISKDAKNTEWKAPIFEAQETQTIALKE